MTRHEFDVEALSGGEMYRLLTAVVVPRPIAWVSTRSTDGVDNLAPHSFFTIACARPPIVQFTSVGEKDTLRNVRSGREFVVHLTPEPLLEAVNRTGADQPGSVSEFDDAGLTREPARLVGPARVAESPVALECRLHSTLELGDSTVVFGRVVHVAVADDALVESAPGRPPHPDYAALAPVARLGRDDWALPARVRTVARPSYPGGRDRSSS